MAARVSTKISKTCPVCGKSFHVYPCEVKSGHGIFCGKSCKAKHQFTTHGETKTRLYGIWRDMKCRCLLPTNKAWKRYGGRGISVCQEWIESFITFKAWAIVAGYKEELEIDRIDGNGNYEPKNCRWANSIEQMRNTRKRCDAKTSKFKGVSWCANVNKWRTQLSRKGKPIHIGLFVSEIEAAEAYDSAAMKLYGEFSVLNFPRKEGAVF